MALGFFVHTLAHKTKLSQNSLPNKYDSLTLETSVTEKVWKSYLTTGKVTVLNLACNFFFLFNINTALTIYSNHKENIVDGKCV